MTKTAESELYRLFLIEGLPEPLTPASAHLQVFDNYIEGTRLRLRKVRDPYSNTWTYALQQHIYAHDGETGPAKMAELHLNDLEYGVFEGLEGNEIRKNRYYHEYDQVSFTFDVYLGRLFGLNTARVDFDSERVMEEFVSPPFAIFEVTGDPFFRGDDLVHKVFADVQARVAEIGAANPPSPNLEPDR